MNVGEPLGLRLWVSDKAGSSAGIRAMEAKVSSSQNNSKVITGSFGKYTSSAGFEEENL